MNDRRRERLRQDQMKHADDVDLSVEAVDVKGGGFYFITRATEHITSNMSEVIRTLW